jgi:hypothetical protein
MNQKYMSRLADLLCFFNNFIDNPHPHSLADLCAFPTPLSIVADVHIVVDPVLSVSAAHQIAERVRLRVRRAMPAVADLLVHIGALACFCAHAHTIWLCFFNLNVKLCSAKRKSFLYVNL